MRPESPREIAVRVLRRRRHSPEYVETLLEQELARAGLSRLDRALCQQLVYGTVRWEKTLDWLIARKTDGRATSAGWRKSVCGWGFIRSSGSNASHPMRLSMKRWNWPSVWAAGKEPAS